MKNNLVLAYLGDAIYELAVRKYLINQGINNVNDLQKMSLNYVSAKSQKQHLDRLIANEILTTEEIEIVKRGRNTKSNTKSKSADIITYRLATGLECLLGELYFSEKKTRIDEIMKFILED